MAESVADVRWPHRTVSAGGDAARLDATNNAKVPGAVRRRRWAMEQVIGATLVDRGIARAFGDVRFVLCHPDIPAYPALLERVVADGAPRQTDALWQRTQSACLENGFSCSGSSGRD
ncbi:hypothetical protein ACF08B_36385 [Streptomyces sp. NPDC015139]|uniref:hypothetical protein n=1 Tax=Streptomyces sp. NPDC015139 TaxID=3364942 RepID=UPI00370236B9